MSSANISGFRVDFGVVDFYSGPLEGTANSKHRRMNLRTRLLLLLAVERKKGHTRDLDDLRSKVGGDTIACVNPES